MPPSTAGIRPISSPRIAGTAMEDFYRQLTADDRAEPQLARMQTRQRLCEAIVESRVT